MADYKALATNRRARYDFAVTDTVLAGIVLTGAEVKSVRGGHVSMSGSFASFRASELWLNNLHISPYPPATLNDYVPTRARKLLVHRHQLGQLARASQSGRSIIVLSIGHSGSYIKVELGMGRGRKRYDKREHIKRREAKRDAAKLLRRRPYAISVRLIVSNK